MTNPFRSDVYAYDDEIRGVAGANVLTGYSQRGGLPFRDRNSQAPETLMQRAGLWTAGTSDVAEINPELVSLFYRTAIGIAYTAMSNPGDVAVDDILTDASGWVARVFSINTTAKTAILSLYSGTTTLTSTLTVTTAVAGVLGGTLTGVTFLGASAGVTTGYGDTSGLKAPWSNPAPTTRIYNCLGSRQDVTAGNPTHRFPLRPESYNRTVHVPKGRFTHGAKLFIEFAGVVKNTLAAPDSAKLHVTLNIGEAIFTTLALGLANARVRMRFESTEFPAIASEIPFAARLSLYNSRKQDRTEGMIGLLEFFSGSHSYVVGLQRGSDKVVTPTTFTGFELENGDDTTNKRTKRDIGVWIAVSPLLAATVGGEFYVNVHNIKATLERRGHQ